MKISIKLMKSIRDIFEKSNESKVHAKEFPINEFEEYFVLAIERIFGIEKKLKSYNEQKNALTDKLKKSISDIESHITVLRERCKHELVSFQIDASGGMDSTRICDICGLHF